MTILDHSEHSMQFGLASQVGTQLYLEGGLDHVVGTFANFSKQGTQVLGTSPAAIPVWKNWQRCPQYGPSRPPKLLKPSSKLLGRPPKLMERQELPNQEFCPSISNNSKITPNSTRGISTFISKISRQVAIVDYLLGRLVGSLENKIANQVSLV